MNDPSADCGRRVLLYKLSNKVLIEFSDFNENDGGIL